MLNLFWNNFIFTGKWQGCYKLSFLLLWLALLVYPSLFLIPQLRGSQRVWVFIEHLLYAESWVGADGGQLSLPISFSWAAPLSSIIVLTWYVAQRNKELLSLLLSGDTVLNLFSNKRYRSFFKVTNWYVIIHQNEREAPFLFLPASSMQRAWVKFRRELNLTSTLGLWTVTAIWEIAPHLQNTVSLDSLCDSV